AGHELLRAVQHAVAVCVDEDLPAPQARLVGVPRAVAVVVPVDGPGDARRVGQLAAEILAGDIGATGGRYAPDPIHRPGPDPPGKRELPDVVRARPDVGQRVTAVAEGGGERLAGVEDGVVVEIVEDRPAGQARLARRGIVVPDAVAVDVVVLGP